MLAHVMIQELGRYLGVCRESQDPTKHIWYDVSLKHHVPQDIPMVAM